MSVSKERKQQLRKSQIKRRKIRENLGFERVEIYLSAEAVDILSIKSQAYNLTRGDFVNLLLLSYDKKSLINKATKTIDQQEHSNGDKLKLIEDELLKEKEKMIYWRERYQELCVGIERTDFKLID